MAISTLGNEYDDQDLIDLLIELARVSFLDYKTCDMLDAAANRLTQLTDPNEIDLIDIDRD